MNPNDIMVGDTEDDIQSGIDLGCRVYMVCSGIRLPDAAGVFADKAYVIDNISSLI